MGVLIVIGIFATIIMILMLACCVVASRCDEKMKSYYKAALGEDFYEKDNN